MAASSRRKGVTGEREVAALWQAAGFDVRNLEGLGDHMVILNHLPNERSIRPNVHCEVKRQERVRLPEWLAQAKREAPQGIIPVVAFRQNQGEWYVALPLAALVELAS
jgi:hypothetical protein